MYRRSARFRGRRPRPWPRAPLLLPDRLEIEHRSLASDRQHVLLALATGIERQRTMKRSAGSAGVGASYSIDIGSIR